MVAGVANVVDSILVVNFFLVGGNGWYRMTLSRLAQCIRRLLMGTAGGSWDAKA